MLTSPQSAPPAPWQVPANAFNQKQRRHNSAPFPAPGSTPRGSLDGSSIPFSPEGPASVAGSDLEEDFDSPCYFATYPDEINPDLSIGLIEWKAALPTKRALPSTFAEAELEALAPRKPHASDDESISEYFINDRREEAFLSVRQTDGWWDVKDDLIFREFSAVCAEVITIAELLFRYRERFDPHWATMGRESETPELSRETTPAQYDHRDTSVDSRMDVDGGYDHRTGQSGALDSLEKALLANPNERANGSAKHSRSTSVVSQNSTNVKKPKPLPLFRDQTQEEMLAALGVTGSPKMVYETPGPAFGPLPPDFASTNNRLAKTTNRANGAFPGGTNSQLPTPISNVSKRSPSFDPWKSSQPGNEHKAERPNSSCSQRTATGSDFYPEDNDSTPRPKFTRHDSRKRGLVDSEDEAYAPDDDATPKQRRKHPRVEAAYRYVYPPLDLGDDLLTSIFQSALVKAKTRVR